MTHKQTIKIIMNRFDPNSQLKTCNRFSLWKLITSKSVHWVKSNILTTLNDCRLKESFLLQFSFGPHIHFDQLKNWFCLFVCVCTFFSCFCRVVSFACLKWNAFCNQYHAHPTKWIRIENIHRLGWNNCNDIVNYSTYRWR